MANNKKLIDTMFGNGEQFIIDSTHLPDDGVSFKYLIVLNDITGFSCDNNNLIDGSGDWPATLPAGTELPSGIKNIAVSDGAILGLIK